MNKSDGTNSATRGFPRITRGHPKAQLHLVGLAVTALLGAALIIWVNRNTSGRVENLLHEFSSMKADRFYLGVRMRSDILRLNETLLRYRLRGETADAEDFRSQLQTLGYWLATGGTNATTPLERKFFDRMGSAYGEFSAESLKVLEANRAYWLKFQTKDQAFRDTYEKVRSQSQQLLESCDTFINAQSAAFDTFLRDSADAMISFQRLLQLSLFILFLLASTLAVLAYRGMIAPLRFRITESEAIIARQEKLASLGVLAAGVAHEIRNPLTAIKFRLFSLRKGLPANGPEREDAAVIGDEISRLEKIVKDFLQFARPSEPELVAVPARRIVQEVHDLLKPQLAKAHIQLTIGPSAAAWVRADVAQIKQVLINLVQNAADSITRDGQVTLTVREDKHGHLDGKGTVYLEVADNGKGIPPDVQTRLFDPFFTTKEGGTGLGLPIAARIVEKHGGELHYRTELNRGTTFEIELPRVEGNESQNIAH